MRPYLFLTVVFFLWADSVYCQRWTESLDEWCLGVMIPELDQDRRADGSLGKYMVLPVGTDGIYYEGFEPGEGSVILWVYDPGECVADPNPGYSQFGPRWGVQDPVGNTIAVGISRHANLQGCRGYSVWSSVAPLEYRWFNDGVRAADDVSWSGGWYKWTIDGTWDDIRFTLHDVDYDSNPAPDSTTVVHGNVTRKFNAQSYGSLWAPIFGEGWFALYARGDDETGVEEICLDKPGGSGVFAGVTGDPPLYPLSQGKIAAGCVRYPAIISVPAGTVFVGDTYNYQVVVSDSNTPVSLTASCATTIIPFDIVTATFAWTPTMNDTGLHFVTLEATVDNIPVDWQNFGVRVMEEVGIDDFGLRITDLKASRTSNARLYDLRGNQIQRPTGHGIFIEVDEARAVRKRVWHGKVNY